MTLIDYLKNIFLRSVGADRDLLQLLADGDVSGAKSLFDDHTTDVEQALREYDPASHKIMTRPNKLRKNRDDYTTEKLPRSWQEHINEVELFFLLNNPIKWTLKSDHEEGFELFKKFLNDQRFNSTMREAKRLAGAETQSAKLYHVYRENDEAKCLTMVLSKSKGYDLFPLFNQYGQMLAMGVGYYLKENERTVEHFDIYMADTIYRCKRSTFGWSIEPSQNVTGKINLIYYRQDKAWRNAQVRIERDELLDSKTADINNYFADPMVAATADVIEKLADPETVGKLIHLSSRESDFRYIEPPTSIEMKETEKANNREAILTDTFTPPFDFKSMTNLGNLSGKAIERIMTIGYIKRNRNIEIYDELVDREKNVIIEILKVLHPNVNFDGIEIDHKFEDPFMDGLTKEEIMSAHAANLLSTESAVRMLGFVDDTDAELARLQAQADALIKEPDVPKEQQNIGMGEK